MSAKLRVSMTLQARTRLITFRLADLVNEKRRCGARTSARPPPCAAGCVKCIRARPRSERKATAASHRKITAAHQSGGQDKCASSNSSSTDSCMLQLENESPMIRIIWLEVPNTKHYWAAATDDCNVGILLGLRQRVTATIAPLPCHDLWPILVRLTCGRCHSRPGRSLSWQSALSTHSRKHSFAYSMADTD